MFSREKKCMSLNNFGVAKFITEILDGMQRRRDSNARCFLSFWKGNAMIICQLGAFYFSSIHVKLFFFQGIVLLSTNDDIINSISTYFSVREYVHPLCFFKQTKRKRSNLKPLRPCVKIETKCARNPYRYYCKFSMIGMITSPISPRYLATENLHIFKDSWHKR